MALDLRGISVVSWVVLGVAMGCDPKVATPDDDGTLEQNDGGASDGDDADDSDDADDDDVPGTGAGSGDVPDCGDACPEPPPSVQHAYAIRFGDLPAVDVGESDSGGSGGTDIDPNTLLVVITTGADGCDDPWAALACGQWSVSFSLPPGTTPGSYALFPDLNGMQTATGPIDETGECWFGGGTLEGTVELTTTEGAIAGRIVGASAFDFDANVEFVATLCE